MKTRYLTQAKLAACLLLISLFTPNALAQNLPLKASVREVKDTYFGQTITEAWIETRWYKSRLDGWLRCVWGGKYFNCFRPLCIEQCLTSRK